MAAKKAAAMCGSGDEQSGNARRRWAMTRAAKGVDVALAELHDRSYL